MALEDINKVVEGTRKMLREPNKSLLSVCVTIIQFK